MHDSHTVASPLASTSCSSVSLSPCPPFSSVSVSPFLPLFLSHLLLRIRSAAFPIPSTGTIDVSIPVGWCSLAFATVSACSKSAGVVCPAVPRLLRVPPSVIVLVHSRSTVAPPPAARLLLVSKSMGRVLAVERVRNPRRPKSARVRNRGIGGLWVFDPSRRTRDI